MSVRKNDRNLSGYEYEHTFELLYKETENRMKMIPKRRREFLCEPITNIMNGVYNLITSISFDFTYKGIKGSDNKDKIQETIELLLSVQKYMYAFWSIQNTELRVSAAWCEMANKEIKLLCGTAKIERKDEWFMTALDIESAEKFLILKKARQFHKFLNGKIISSKATIKNTRGYSLWDMADSILYHLCEGNKKPPETKDEYETRRKHFQQALDKLNAIERPTLAYFNLMDYSENVMHEWSEYINELQNMLNSLIAADKARYANLQ